MLPRFRSEWGPLELVPGPYFENHQCSLPVPSWLVLLPFWCSGSSCFCMCVCVCVCIISINFVLRKREVKVKQWRADCIRTPHLRDSPSPILGRFQDPLEDWGIGQPKSFQGCGWEGGDGREGERTEMPRGWNADALTSNPQWPVSWNWSFSWVEWSVQPVSALLRWDPRLTAPHSQVTLVSSPGTCRFRAAS